MIKRDSYLNRMIHHMWNGEIKVLTGIRGCGKTVLLFDLFYDYLLSRGVQENHIIKIALDQKKYEKYRNPITLCEFIESVVSENTKERFYLFIDEVQLTAKVMDEENGGIEVSIYDMLNELRAYKNLDVYVTADNGKGLSKDIPSEFRGRATRIPVFPLSFQEFYSHVGGDPEETLNTYMLYGGMPKLLRLDEETDKKAYLTSLYNELYTKDITRQCSIKYEELFHNILDVLALKVGFPTNPRGIAGALTDKNRKKVNSALVSDYTEHMMDAFLIDEVKRYHIKRKTYFKFPNKYYCTDMGLLHARQNSRQYNPEGIMENILYNELVRRGYQVDVGVVIDRTGGLNLQREINFIVQNADQKVYLQVAYQMDPDETESAKRRALMLTGDFFKKMIVRMDIPHHFYDEQGIFHCNLIVLLLGKVDLF